MLWRDERVIARSIVLSGACTLGIMEHPAAEGLIRPLPTYPLQGARPRMFAFCDIPQGAKAHRCHVAGSMQPGSSLMPCGPVCSPDDSSTCLPAMDRSPPRRPSAMIRTLTERPLDYPHTRRGFHQHVGVQTDISRIAKHRSIWIHKGQPCTRSMLPCCSTYTAPEWSGRDPLSSHLS